MAKYIPLRVYGNHLASYSMCLHSEMKIFCISKVNYATRVVKGTINMSQGGVITEVKGIVMTMLDLEHRLFESYGNIDVQIW